MAFCVYDEMMKLKQGHRRGGGAGGHLPLLLFIGGARGAKVPFS